MAHSQYYPQQAFSPPISTPPAANAPSPNYFPPAKRQRISPNPQSPYDSPSFGTLQLPNAGSPVNGVVTNGAHANMAPPPGSMGPPSLPPSKNTDPSEVMDVLSSSGIDLREEEALLSQPYLNPQQSSGHQNNLGASFNSQGSSFGTLSAGNSFGEYTSRIAGSQATFYGAGPLNQPPGSPKSAEELVAEQQALCIRRAAEREQYHMNNPFLLTGTVELKLSKAGYENQVLVPNQGLYRRVNNQPPPPPIEVKGPDGSSIVATKGSALIMKNDSPLADLLALLSLACEERILGVVEESATLAKHRREHSHGVVPPEWADLAVDEEASGTTAAHATATSALDSGVSPGTLPSLKRSFSATQLPSASENRSSLVIPNYVAQALRKVAQKEREIEERRLQKRARRAADAAAGGESGRTPSISTPGAPGTPGLLAPDSDKKATKKELRKAADAKATEAQQHAHANETARMAMGGSISFGGKKKTYSWMTAGAGSGTSTPKGFGPSRINTAVNNSTPGTPSGGGTGTATAPGMVSVGRRFGEWREDKEKGEGIQLRDVLHVLEDDSKSARVVQKAYVRMGTKPGTEA